MKLVAGAGGFIGGHLVASLLDQGHKVRAVDIKPFEEWHQLHSTENLCLDLSALRSCEIATDGVDEVYNLAADMGGIGFIESHKADCMLSVLINTHLLKAAHEEGVSRYFYASSACVYPAERQDSPGRRALRESFAYPADPEDGYGWEKLFSERMCRHFTEDYGLETRVARLHNVYGPHGTYEGGREKAPAAICRKVAQAKLEDSNELEIWGDGKQTRSFMYVDDCIEGIHRIMKGESAEPVNLGSSELVTIHDLGNLVCAIADHHPFPVYDLDAPQGVRGRNSDNTLIKERYGWEPSISLWEGLKPTYEWIAEQVGAHVPA